MITETLHDRVNEERAIMIPTDNFLHLMVWHGNLMLFGCLVLAPTGIFVARYFKETWSIAMFCNHPLWLIIHSTYMISAFLFMLMGIIFARAHATAIHRGYVDDEINHATAGWIAFGIFVLQFIAGNWLPFCPGDIRTVFRLIHSTLGFVATYFCVVVGMLSGIMASSKFPYFSSTIIVGWICFSVIIHCCTAFVCHRGDREVLSLEKDGFMIYYRAFIPLPVPTVKVTPPGSDLRLLLFLWYQFGAVAAFIPIFISNSEGQGKGGMTVQPGVSFNSNAKPM